MPKFGKGTECIKLLLSQATKDMREPLVPMLFPILGAHVSATEFRYPDNTLKELCGQMANLVAESGAGKGQLGYLVDAICRDFILHDKEVQRNLDEWRREVNTKGANKERPERPDVRLNEFLEDKGQKMEFVFDPFSERSFFLNVRDIITGKDLNRAEVKRMRGDAPIHIAELGAAAPIAHKVTPISDDEDELFSASGFDDEDIGPEGFEISQAPY